jgi:hypothetical protein
VGNPRGAENDAFGLVEVGHERAGWAFDIKLADFGDADTACKSFDIHGCADAGIMPQDGCE